jgi:predicted aminopeptidase
MLLLYKQIQRSRRRRIWLIVVLGLLAFGFWQKENLKYAYQAVRGQWRLVTQARPLAEVMADKTFPDSLKKRLEVISQIRRYAIDSLGLKDTDSYQKLYDLKGKPICYMLVVAEPYKLKAVDWWYPVVGRLAYRGFFELDDIKKERELWINKGYDTRINDVAAYSTLGWFKDPILSSMLKYDDGQLAELLIHEMTHATLFMSGGTEINENLANFIGDYGAMRFMKQKYGPDSKQFKAYVEDRRFSEKYVKHINRGTKALDSLYQSFSERTPKSLKDTLKYQVIGQIVSTIDTLYRDLPNLEKLKINPQRLPNNAYFAGFRTYNARQNEFEQEFNQKFKGNFTAYLSFLKSKYGI